MPARICILFVLLVPTGTAIRLKEYAKKMVESVDSNDRSDELTPPALLEAVFSAGDIVEATISSGGSQTVWGFVQDDLRSMKIVTRGLPETIEPIPEDATIIASNERFTVPGDMDSMVFDFTEHGMFLVRDDESAEVKQVCEEPQSDDGTAAKTFLREEIARVIQALRKGYKSPTLSLSGILPSGLAKMFDTEMASLNVGELRELLKQAKVKETWLRSADDARKFLEAHASELGYDPKTMQVGPMVVPTAFGTDKGIHSSITLPYSSQPTQQWVNIDECQAGTAKFPDLRYDPGVPAHDDDRILQMPKFWALPRPSTVKFLFGSPQHDDHTGGPVMVVLSNEDARRYMNNVRWLFGWMPFPEFHSVHSTWAKVTSKPEYGGHPHFRFEVVAAWPQRPREKFPDPIYSLDHCSSARAFESFDGPLTLEKLGEWASASPKDGGWKSDRDMVAWVDELVPLLEGRKIHVPIRDVGEFNLMLRLLLNRFTLKAATYQALGSSDTMTKPDSKSTTCGSAQAAIGRLYYTLDEAAWLSSEHRTPMLSPDLVKLLLTRKEIDVLTTLEYVQPRWDQDIDRAKVAKILGQRELQSGGIPMYLCTMLSVLLQLLPGADNYKDDVDLIMTQLNILSAAEKFLAQDIGLTPELWDKIKMSKGFLRPKAQ